MVPRDRIELPSAPCKDAALPLDERGIFGGRRRSRTPSLLREPGFQGQSRDQPHCIIFRNWSTG